jgi:hypothetical protein
MELCICKLSKVKSLKKFYICKHARAKSLKELCSCKVARANSREEFYARDFALANTPIKLLTLNVTKPELLQIFPIITNIKT